MVRNFYTSRSKNSVEMRLLSLASQGTGELGGWVRDKVRRWGFWAQPRARAFPNIPVTGSGGPWLPMKTT